MLGQTISHYRILEKLGEGGMGVVYKAEDTKLERTVALKFLAAHLLNDQEAKQRFLREAKAAAALTHANICHVYEIDQTDGKTFISMAFIEGETLEDRVSRGPLPIQDALDIGQQVAKGLQAAHEKGIVHRDIKPANILVARDGQVTIMDFGLARLTEASKLTRADQTLGTAAYMSPEQIQGAEVDHRTDVWALGCVLYEVIAGLRPFKGQYDQALLYEICNQQPEPLTGVRAGVPMELEVFVGKCLAKNAADRYGSAAELANDLRTLAEKMKSGRSMVLPAARSQVTAHQPERAASPLSLRAWQALAALALLAAVGIAFVHFGESAPERPDPPLRRFSFAPEGVLGGVISPDGKQILYVAQTNGRSSLWLRPLNSESAREIPGTAGVLAGLAVDAWGIGAFWSPDSAAIGFAVGSPDFKLKRVSIDGGDPVTLSDLPAKASTSAFLGGTWSPDGARIVFSSDHRLYEIAVRGGQPRLLFDPGGVPRPRSSAPHFLPTGSGPPGLLYDASSTYSDHAIAVLNLATGERRELIPGTLPVYSPGGYLIHGPSRAYLGEVGLAALPFSLATLELAGEAFPISTTGSGASVSQDGMLAYTDAAGGDAGLTLVWRDRSGKRLETIGQPQPSINDPALSPDGRQVAVSSDEGGNFDIWVHDDARSTKSRLTFDAEAEVLPAWLPSGREVAYSRVDFGAASSNPELGIRRRAADGTGEPVDVIQSGRYPNWSRDGRYMVYGVLNPDTSWDICYVQVKSDGSVSEPVTFLNTAATEMIPQISPDGRFLAYVSNESGRNEIFVRPFPEGARKWQASLSGAKGPHWSRDGTELYYVQDDTVLMAVSVSTKDGLTLGRPRKLFESTDLIFGPLVAQYDVSADGRRFVTIAPVEGPETAPARIRIVENWYAEFRGREQD